MSDVTAFNNCMSVFWRQHEAELARFLTSKTGDSEKAADLLQELFLRARAHSDSFVRWRIHEPGCTGLRGTC
jgi:RNA polymerase sigma-70 factor (ECF subfamily)